ncbi:MAG: class I SAM-dependent methyltransferase [Leptospiraceae bacterium]|nr:class I SAM-dependent methyltransferase [Leptospiraceae bacterium]
MTAQPYDRHYQTRDLFGDPLPALIAFFEQLQPGRRVWDMGAGQGRDTLPLARMGHQVRAIDSSRTGLDCIAKAAAAARLANITTLCADVHSLKVAPECQVLLFDAMFHFYKRDRASEMALLERVSNQLSDRGILACAVPANQTTAANLALLHQSAWASWGRLTDVESRHEHTGTLYRFLALEKVP